jgi:adenine-specific DNA-methyltransferase
MAEQDFIKAGFTVVGTENNENKLLSFLKENYPNVIRDTEINLEELKTVLGLPIDEKVNGYGLNFVGRNFARAKYAQKTEKELRLNNTLSKSIDTTENLVLKGDNLDSLKILKNHYSGQVKCIYIDPPYNTTSEEFIYPDKFDKEEAEVLGLANLSESDFARMDFSFKTKKSHNGWLAFMYPRLLLARDLLSKDGVIFISIDDNEVAQLRLLMDDIFGEENFVSEFIWEKKKKPSFLHNNVGKLSEYIICYLKNSTETFPFSVESTTKGKKYPFNNAGNSMGELVFPAGSVQFKMSDSTVEPQDMSEGNIKTILKTQLIIEKGVNKNEFILEGEFRYSQDTLNEIIKNKEGIVVSKIPFRPNHIKKGGEIKKMKNMFSPVHYEMETNEDGTAQLVELIGDEIFTNPKPVKLINTIIKSVTYDDDSSIILDFFAGSGTTGHAVMQLNAEDGGNRKFILCQIDEPIKEDKPAYKFCIDNNLPPVISSITVERLKRAGEKIAKDIETENSKTGMFEEDKKQVPDIGFKVFDSVEAPKLKVDDKGQISFTENQSDALSRIYNMIFTVGLDEPTQVPEEVVKDCIYKIGNHYYITNSEKITSDDYSNAIKNGKVFIDGWTASLNGTLQNYKEDVKIVF